MPKTRLPATIAEILKEEYLGPLGLTADDLAVGAHIERIDVQRIMDGFGINIAQCFKLAAFFNTTPEYWFNLNHARLWEIMKTSPDLKREVRKIKPVNR